MTTNIELRRIIKDKKVKKCDIATALSIRCFRQY